MHKNNAFISSAPGSCVGSCIEGFAFNARPFLLLLMLLGLLLSLTAQANGLFDFQMKLANKGNAEAQFKVGEMYETGFGVKQDMKQAESWINKAASKGHETAGFKLLYWDVEKNGLNGENSSRVDDLKAKAKAGNEQAQYYVGKMYAHGVGMKQDSDAAIEWLSKSALVGVLAAERELIAVKDEKQRTAMAQRQAQQKQAELQQREKQLELERQRKLREQQKAQALADKAAKQRAAEQAAARKAAEDAAARKAAEEAAARKAAEKKQGEAQQQALLKQNQQKEVKRKQQFEADPCSGKSAKFLSTCR